MHFKQCEHFECYDIAAEPANKATILTSSDTLTGVLNLSYRSGSSSLELLDEIIKTIPMSVMFPFHSPLYEVFNKKIYQLLSTGLIYHWYNHEINRKGLKLKPEEIGPQILTMEHVSIGFLICFIPLALSVLTFLIEIAVFKCKVFDT